jgi:hypothetical protein
VFEAGIWPSGVFVLTTWYTPQQLSLRVSIFYLGATLSVERASYIFHR